jgi:hypothetical protein
MTPAFLIEPKCIASRGSRFISFIALIALDMTSSSTVINKRLGVDIIVSAAFTASFWLLNFLTFHMTSSSVKYDVTAFSPEDILEMILRALPPSSSVLSSASMKIFESI